MSKRVGTLEEFVFGDGFEVGAVRAFAVFLGGSEEYVFVDSAVTVSDFLGCGDHYALSGFDHADVIGGIGK